MTLQHLAARSAFMCASATSTRQRDFLALQSAKLGDGIQTRKQANTLQRFENTEVLLELDKCNKTRRPLHSTSAVPLDACVSEVSTSPALDGDKMLLRMIT
mmetsp:Transcript_22677/g.38805  ORF Transcript_22677/g.38805 Transcript_22677/m.38805 type:complete len:101 (+) Transcript_22677:163-465(+)